ncbi:O-antigen polymerase (modular protein) [Mesorhizobium sp. ORS 3324]|nr:O-antigen polymerase (modular protein) [Mesorhizobium sp. ORS 3324]
MVDDTHQGALRQLVDLFSVYCAVVSDCGHQWPCLLLRLPSVIGCTGFAASPSTRFLGETKVRASNSKVRATKHLARHLIGVRTGSKKSLHCRLQTAPAASCDAAGVTFSECQMQLGEMIANLFAALMLMCVVAAVFFVAGKPLWPHREAKMTVVLPPDAITTGSVRAPTHPRLPDTVDAGLVQPRPQ